MRIRKTQAQGLKKRLLRHRKRAALGLAFSPLALACSLVRPLRADLPTGENGAFPPDLDGAARLASGVTAPLHPDPALLAFSVPQPLGLTLLSVACGAMALGLILTEVLRRLRKTRATAPTQVAAVRAVPLPPGGDDSIALLDAEARVVEANGLFQREAGLSLDQIRGRPIWALHQRGFGKVFWETVLQEARHSGSWSGETRTLGDLRHTAAKGLSVTLTASPDDQLIFEFRSRRHPGAERALTDTASATGRGPAEVLASLPSRRAMRLRVEQAIHRAARDQSAFALMVIDLDRFRDINSIFGDDIGDRILERLAVALRAVTQPGITVGRIGGDEFILLVEDTTGVERLNDVAEGIFAALGDEVVVDGMTCRLSASIGIAQFPKDGRSQRDLMQSAGVALCHAKERGRGQICYFAESLEHRSEESLQMEADLRRAISQGELLMHYQPQVDLRTGQCVGAEALLRWQHPQKGLLLPAGFVPLALDSGLTTAIDRFVLREVCRQIGRWKDAGLHPPRISINMSALSLLATDFATDLRRHAAEAGVEMTDLEIEVLESSLFPRMTNIDTMIEDLRTLGLRLAIDDFGTGYSSLALLKDLPIDRIKLDRRFIKNLPRDIKDDRIVAAVVAMGKSLGISVIAEGVETAEQRQRLLTLGCTEAQGFLFSRPIAPENFARDWMTGESEGLRRDTAELG